MRLISFLAVLLTTFLSLTAAAPSSNVTLAKRLRPGSYLSPGSPTAVIQWTSDYGNLNNMRNYHIRSDGYIMESRRTSRDGAWTTINTGLLAHSGGGMVAGVHKWSENLNDVEIRLFYQHDKTSAYDKDMDLYYYRMKSAVLKPGQSWTVDTQFFNDIGYVANPRAVVTWLNKNNEPRWRLYFMSSQDGKDWSWMKAAMNLYGEGTNPITSYNYNTVYEAQFPTDPRNPKWTLGNGGKSMATSQQPLYYPGAIAAVAWKFGTRISVFYWDTEGLDDWTPTPGIIREIRWIEGRGWVRQDVPNNDFKNFSPSGSLTAVTWIDGSGVD